MKHRLRRASETITSKAGTLLSLDRESSEIKGAETVLRIAPGTSGRAGGPGLRQLRQGVVHNPFEAQRALLERVL